MKRYSVYRNLDNKYFGEIPLGWIATRLKFCSNLINGYAFSSDSYVEDGIPIIRIGDIKPSINLTETKKVPKQFAESHSAFLILNGDILLALTGATIGKMAVYELYEDALLNQRVAIVRPKAQINNDYLKFLVGSQLFKNHIDFECVGGAQDNIGKPEIGEFALSLPPLSEQNLIGKYLDHKTHLIDTLIEKKQKQIELLQEQRAAIINQAVTKGLNPNVKMKDSGIEWLGEVPEHWLVAQLKHYVSVIETGPFGSQLHSEEYVENETPVLNPANIKNGKIYPNWNCCLSASTVKRLERHMLQKGDILFARRGEMGRCAEVLGNQSGWICGTGCIKVRPMKSNILSAFLSFFLSINGIKDWLSLESVGSTMENLNSAIIGRIPVPIPSINEQEEVTNYIVSKTRKIDKAIDQLKDYLSILKEYRTALISDVVTGKIDVRDEAIPA